MTSSGKNSTVSVAVVLLAGVLASGTLSAAGVGQDMGWQGSGGGSGMLGGSMGGSGMGAGSGMLGGPGGTGMGAGSGMLGGTRMEQGMGTGSGMLGGPRFGQAMDPGMVNDAWGKAGMKSGVFGGAGSNWSLTPEVATERLNAFKQSVGITLAQEATWMAYSKTLTDQNDARNTLLTDLNNMAGTGQEPAAVEARRIEFMERMVMLKKITLQAYRALYAQLDDRQKGLIGAVLDFGYAPPQ